MTTQYIKNEDDLLTKSLDDLTMNLTGFELLHLLQWHWLTRGIVTRASIKDWIKKFVPDPEEFLGDE